MTIRYIHLEFVESFDADDFINFFSRFTNRSGCLKVVFYDLDSNFNGETNKLKEAIELLAYQLNYMLYPRK